MIEIAVLYFLFFVTFVFVTSTCIIVQKRIDIAMIRISDLERYSGLDGD